MIFVRLAYNRVNYFHCLVFKWCAHHCTWAFPFPSPWTAYILQSIVETTDGKESDLSLFCHSLYSLNVFASLLLPLYLCLFLSLSSLFLSGSFTGSYHVFSLRQALRDLLQSAQSRKPTWAGYTEGIILYLTIMTLFCLSCPPSHFLCSPLLAAADRNTLFLLLVFISL